MTYGTNVMGNLQIHPSRKICTLIEEEEVPEEEVPVPSAPPIDRDFFYSQRMFATLWKHFASVCNI